MEKDEYVIYNEFEGSHVGTMDEILEWVSENDVNISYSKFYELGNEILVELKPKQTS